ncbi:hypothetical protein ACH5RR_026346 [Cinchona calisaya]|uniref:Uncharacterized protein n=1 Tax=Cinchona calisaya TaxID=153742 RepID=A0ABD2Z2A8_9GENT
MTSNWRAPNEGSVKINIDAAIDLTMIKFRIEIVVRDNNGNILNSLASQENKLREAPVEKATAIKTALMRDGDGTLHMGLKDFERVCDNGQGFKRGGEKGYAKRDDRRCGEEG